MTQFPPTADICDALGHAVRVIDLPLKSFTDVTVFAGPAKLITLYGPDVALADLLRGDGEGAVAVVQVHNARKPAVFGDGMARAAEANNWAGVLIDGNLRDTALIAPRRVGVLATGINPRIERTGPLAEADQPTTLGTTPIAPGDWIVADADSTLILTTEQAAQLTSGKHQAT
ncbi:regulator of ribonuclease activity A [Rubricella aquisinus]|uniref:Putative 4-hydroxy-4-methyl-2-oxoglutarate aldolase n=1 Tax=Rubricella aquisinus TaxID=2028108 RepID=A0A840WP35_9RHOB|nr:S-adenosylmethionine--2-demethylmenaquinone methyltransferase [Rubricella aquisinus]MBB5515843.1 regulator of ribonuclease activity A [Rubricella aquisinus]